MPKRSHRRPAHRLALLALGAGAALVSSHAAALGLEEAYQAALLHDPTYQAAAYAGAAGQENAVLGRANLLPQVSGSYSGSHNRTDITSFRTTHPVYFSRSSQLNLRQTLFNLDALARYRQGAAQARQATAQQDAARQDLIVRVIGAYLDAIYADDQLVLAKAQRDTLAEQKAVNDRLYKGGEGTVTDMLETQAKLDVAAARVLEMEDTRRAALVNLSGMVGMEVTSLDKLRADFKVRAIDTGTFEKWQKQALDANPVIQAQRFEIDVAHEEFNKARAGQFPRVDFVANYSKNDSDTLNTLDQKSTVRSVGVQVSIPIFAGGSVSAAARQAKDNEMRAQAEMQAKSDQVMVELRKAYDGVVSGVAHIAALEKAVASGELLAKATSQSIKGGVRINLDLLNAQEQLYTARRDLAQARYTYLLATLRVRAAAGNLSAADVHDVATYFRGT